MYLPFAVAIEVFDPAVTVRTSAEFSQAQSSLYGWVCWNTTQASLASADLLLLTGQEQLHAETSNVSREFQPFSWMKHHVSISCRNRDPKASSLSITGFFFYLSGEWLWKTRCFCIVHTDLMLQCLNVAVLARTRTHTKTNPNPSSLGTRHVTCILHIHSCISSILTNQSPMSKNRPNTKEPRCMKSSNIYHNSVFWCLRVELKSHLFTSVLLPSLVFPEIREQSQFLKLSEFRSHLYPPLCPQPLPHYWISKPTYVHWGLTEHLAHLV